MESTEGVKGQGCKPVFHSPVKKDEAQIAADCGNINTSNCLAFVKANSI